MEDPERDEQDEVAEDTEDLDLDAADTEGVVGGAGERSRLTAPPAPVANSRS